MDVSVHEPQLLKSDSPRKLSWKFHVIGGGNTSNRSLAARTNLRSLVEWNQKAGCSPLSGRLRVSSARSSLARIESVRI